MACGTNRCALRRFEGHGSSSYRPSNPEAAKVFNDGMQGLLAERARQDSGIFTGLPLLPLLPLQPQQQSPQMQQSPQIQQPTQASYYSLSDAAFSATKKQASPK
jgi:hypothetical protein